MGISGSGRDAETRFLELTGAERWISNVENGWRNPSYASLRRLAAGLDLSASELLALAEQIESDAASSASR
jgi:transcriptional regulator with XRE-family HTH domain